MIYYIVPAIQTDLDGLYPGMKCYIDVCVCLWSEPVYYDCDVLGKFSDCDGSLCIWESLDSFFRIDMGHHNSILSSFVSLIDLT